MKYLKLLILHVIFKATAKAAQHIFPVMYSTSSWTALTEYGLYWFPVAQSFSVFEQARMLRKLKTHKTHKDKQT